MTDRDVVERARDLTGVGHVNFRKRHNPERKDQWAWRVRVLRDAAGIMQTIRPHMGERRRARIDAALAAAKTPTSKGAPVSYMPNPRCHHIHEKRHPLFRDIILARRVCGERMEEIETKAPNGPWWYCPKCDRSPAEQPAA